MDTNEDDYAVTSPGEDNDLDVVLEAPEPTPGKDGVPVRWYDADRSESYTHTTPFQEKHDPSVEFFYKPITLTVLSVSFGVMGYVAMSGDVLEEGRDKRRVGVYASILAFLLFSILQFRDGPFIRPHPAFWRMILGLNLLYELALVFLLFQDLESARGMMVLVDENLGRELGEKSYGEDCSLTLKAIWDSLDIFCLAHTLGWFGKAMILRDYWFCWVLSVAFELAEYSLAHQLPNFNECWWDHWILDVLICNWLGTWIGMKVCQYLEVKPYSWRGAIQPPSNEATTQQSPYHSPTISPSQSYVGTPPIKKQTRTQRIKSLPKRILRQFSPEDFTSFQWGTAKDFHHYVCVVGLLGVFLCAELDVFYLKTLLWMEPDHPIVLLRLVFIFLWGLPAVRELYQYVNDPRKAVRMGQHCWLLLATILTEILTIIKWSTQGVNGKPVFENPMPKVVKVGLWSGVVVIGGLYPGYKFGIPKVRRWLRSRKRGGKGKVKSM